MNYDVNETFQKDCELCTCYGNDIIHCQEKDCPCFINNNIVFHNGTYTVIFLVSSTKISSFTMVRPQLFSLFHSDLPQRQYRLSQWYVHCYSPCFINNNIVFHNGTSTVIFLVSSTTISSFTMVRIQLISLFRQQKYRLSQWYVHSYFPCFIVTCLNNNISSFTMVRIQLFSLFHQQQYRLSQWYVHCYFPCFINNNIAFHNGTSTVIFLVSPTTISSFTMVRPQLFSLFHQQQYRLSQWYVHCFFPCFINNNIVFHNGTSTVIFLVSSTTILSFTMVRPLLFYF